MVPCMSDTQKLVMTFSAVPKGATKDGSGSVVVSSQGGGGQKVSQPSLQYSCLENSLDRGDSPTSSLLEIFHS
ncbi:hypothetical protein CapIbe_007565 [Capra ibex]